MLAARRGAPAARVPRRRVAGARRAAGAGHGDHGTVLRRSGRHPPRDPLAVRCAAQPRLGTGAAQAFLPQVQFRAAGERARRQHRAVVQHLAQLSCWRRSCATCRARPCAACWCRRCSMRRCSARAGAGTRASRSPCSACATASGCRRSSSAPTRRTCCRWSSPTSSPAPRTSPASATCPTIRWSRRPSPTASTRPWTSPAWSSCCGASRPARPRSCAATSPSHRRSRTPS